jgi:hypothetical protein
VGHHSGVRRSRAISVLSVLRRLKTRLRRFLLAASVFLTMLLALAFFGLYVLLALVALNLVVWVLKRCGVNVEAPGRRERLHPRAASVRGGSG